jgi:hypothetical protein
LLLHAQLVQLLLQLLHLGQLVLELLLFLLESESNFRCLDLGEDVPTLTIKFEDVLVVLEPRVQERRLDT